MALNLRHILKNTGALTAATLLNRTISFFISIPLARYLGDEGLGYYASAYAFVNIFSYFNEFGLSQLMVQKGSRDLAKLPVYFGNAMLVKTIAVVAVYIIMILCMMMMGLSEIDCVLIVILGIAMGFNSINQTIYNYYQTKEKMAVAAGYQFLESLLIALLTLGVIYVTRQGVIAVMAIHLISYALLSVLLLIAIRKQVRPVVDVSIIPQMIVNGLPFGLQRAVNNIFPNVTIFIMAQLLISVRDIGIFRAAYSLVVVLVFLPNAFANSIYPILYRLGADDPIGHQKAMEKVFKILAAVGIPASFFFCMFSTEIIHFVYGDKFAASAAVFAVLSWYFALECLNYPLGDVMTTMNRQRQRAVLQGISLILLVVLTIWAQPRYGLVGSAGAILVVEAFLFLAYYIFIRVKMYPIRIWQQLPSVLLASFIMMGTAYVIRSWHPLLVACLAAMVYLVVLFAIDKELRFLLRRILKRSADCEESD